VIVATLWIAACGFLLFVAAPGFIWLGVLAAVLSFVGPVYNVVQFSYRVALIPDELQGRVNSTFRLVAFGFMPLGAAVSGIVIEHYGVRLAVVLFAACLLVLAILTSLNRHVRDAPSIELASTATA
jgi:hypothetical protein